MDADKANINTKTKPKKSNGKERVYLHFVVIGKKLKLVLEGVHPSLGSLEVLL
jgi:hypothetical protein